MVVGSAIYQNVPSEHSFSFSGILSKSEQIIPSDETFAFAGGGVSYIVFRHEGNENEAV